jgi:outer membrane protein OmpA-like peptidoglycan-associated protein
VALPQTIRFDNLLSAAKAYLTPDVVRNASTATGESETATRQAMQGGVASMFAGLTNMASTSEGTSTLGNLIREPFVGKFMNSFSSSFSGGSDTSGLINSGQSLLGKVFGDRTSGVADVVARSSGVSSSSSGKLMAMLAPLAIGVLGKHAAARGLSGTGLANSLIEQRDEFAAAAPAGLSKLLGDRAPAPVGIHVAPDTEAYRYEAPTPVGTVRTPDRPAGIRWWPLLLIALALLGLLWLFRNIGGRAREAGRQAVATTETALSNIHLPGGTSISVPTGSINDNLAKFLADGSQTVPHTFIFDHLNFQTASTQLTADSEATVTGLSQILKAYPNVHVQLSGYTDNTGASEANQRLSLDRANTVRDMLVSSGIAPDRIVTNGYGEDRPIAPNNTDEGRARNRRTELTVTQK